jgi:polar amino acid transport system permease protein
MDVVFEQYFDFGIMGDEFGFVRDGFWETLQLSFVSGVLALVWGLVLALMRQLPGRRLAPVRGLAIAYIDIFRGIPLLLVVLIISGSAPFVAEGLGLPRSVGIPQWFGKTDPFWYGTLALTVTYGAYMAEVYRAGIEGVPRGQMEAARALGMSHGRAMRHVIVPQAVRRVVPPLLNDYIALMKDTSLVGVIALLEVVEAGRTVQSETLNSSALTLGALMFLVVTLPLARIVDRYIAQSQGRFQRGLATT